MYPPHKACVTLSKGGQKNPKQLAANLDYLSGGRVSDLLEETVGLGVIVAECKELQDSRV